MHVVIMLLLLVYPKNLQLDIYLQEIDILVIHIVKNCFGIMLCCKIRPKYIFAIGMMLFDERNNFLLDALIQVDVLIHCITTFSEY